MSKKLKNYQKSVDKLPKRVYNNIQKGGTKKGELRKEEKENGDNKNADRLT